MNTKRITNIILERVENLLLEGRLEDVKSKYPELSWNQVDKLASIDPSGNNKYLEWLAKNLLPRTIKWFKDNATGGYRGWTVDEVPNDPSDPNWSSNRNLLNKLSVLNTNELLKVQDDLEYFHNNPTKYEKKDINEYTINSLEEATNDAKLKLSRKEQKETGVDKVYEDDDFLLLMPKTHKASCRYGSNTKWCVTMRNTSNYFENYFSQGPIFFLIDKRRIAPTNSMDTPTYYKVAIHYRPFKGGLYKGSDITTYVNKNKEEFLNGANIENSIIEYWNVVDDNKPEVVVKKYLGGPGRGQKKKGDETIEKLKKAMEKYTKEAMSKYYDSINDTDIIELSTKLKDMNTELHSLEIKYNQTRYKLDKLRNVNYSLKQTFDYFTIDDSNSEYYMWLDEQIKKSSTLMYKLNEEYQDMYRKIEKIKTEREEFRKKVNKKSLVFYDTEKNVSISR